MGTTTRHAEMKKDDFSAYVHLYTVKYNYTIMYIILVGIAAILNGSVVRLSGSRLYRADHSARETHVLV